MRLMILRPRALVRALGVAATILMTAVAAAAQPVSVTGANPPTGEQDTASLIVRVTGKNFAPGARADFFKSKTSNPAGVTVRETRFVSATELDTVIDIAPTAELSYFDVRVTNLSGRSGKGSDLFQVVQKVTGNQCLPPSADPRIALLVSLNGVTAGGAPRYQGAMGFSVHSRTVTVNGVSALMVVANADPGAEVFFLTLDGTGGIAVDVANPHRRLVAPGVSGLRITAIGDLNGDGAPDVVSGNRLDATGVVFRGRWESDGTLGFDPSVPIPTPSGIASFYSSVAVGDLDPAYAGDEIAVGVPALGGKQGGGVYLFRLSGSTVVPLSPTFVTPTVSPALTSRDVYAKSIAIADVTGSSDPDLIVGAHTMASGSGEIHVYPGPTSLLDTSASILGRQPYVIRHGTGGEYLGASLSTGDANNDGIADVIGTTKHRVDIIRSQVALSPLGQGHVTDAGYETEAPGGADNVSLGTSPLLARDVNDDGLTDLVGGAPNACLGGKAFVWLGTGSASPWSAPLTLQASTVGGHYGWMVNVGRVGSVSVLLVGETQRMLAGVASAGQVYVYRVGQ